MPASATVGHNTYLVEMILDGMDMKDIFRFQRVSKLWSETITNSTRLQQQLFLKPLPEIQAVPIDHLHKIGYCFNGKCASHSLCLHNADEEGGHDHACKSLIVTDVTYIAPHPVLSARGRLWGLRAWFDLRGTWSPFDSDGIQPSWMNAFITQPPTTVVRAEIHVDHAGSMSRRHQTLRAPVSIHHPRKISILVSRAEGIQFKDVYEQAWERSCSEATWKMTLGAREIPTALRDCSFRLHQGAWVRPADNTCTFTCSLGGNDIRDAVAWWSAGNAGKALPLQTWQVVKPADLQGNARDTIE